MTLKKLAAAALSALLLLSSTSCGFIIVNDMSEEEESESETSETKASETSHSEEVKSYTKYTPDIDKKALSEQYLSELPEGSKNRYAMVGFRVGNTLSENGTVSRGICTTDAEGNLATVVERTKIERRDGAVQYKDDDDQWVTTPDNTPVSMNVWGFTPDYFDYSEDYFKTFLSDPENMANLKAEFFIPLMVNKLINDGTAAVKVLDTTSHWFGVTYPADRQGVVDRIQRLVDEGVYPAKLF